MDNGKLDIEVKVGFKEAINEEIKLMVYLVEKDAVYSNSPQAGSSQGGNYVHHHVLRDVYTDKYSDVIASENVGANGIYTRNFQDLTLPSNILDANKLEVIVFVRNTYTKTFTDYFNDVHTDSPHYDIYNVRKADVGSAADFD